MDKAPSPAVNGSPGGAALKAKAKKLEEKGFFSLCIIAVQPHLFLLHAWHQAPVTAIPTPSSTSAWQGQSGSGTQRGRRERRF